MSKRSTSVVKMSAQSRAISPNNGPKSARFPNFGGDNQAIDLGATGVQSSFQNMYKDLNNKFQSVQNNNNAS